MYTPAARTYEKTDILTTDPHKLVLMLYDASLKHLFLVRKGIQNRDPVMRGEHLSKVIGIITELLSSVNSDPADDAANFLRGLYTAILTQLPKVNVTNEVATINTTIRYMAQLRTIWQEQVVASGGRKIESEVAQKMPSDAVVQGSERQTSVPYGTGAAGGLVNAQSFTCRG
jgi:flagellar protein FliS